MSVCILSSQSVLFSASIAFIDKWLSVLQLLEKRCAVFCRWCGQDPASFFPSFIKCRNGLDCIVFKSQRLLPVGVKGVYAANHCSENCCLDMCNGYKIEKISYAVTSAMEMVLLLHQADL